MSGPKHASLHWHLPGSEDSLCGAGHFSGKKSSTVDGTNCAACLIAMDSARRTWRLLSERADQAAWLTELDRVAVRLVGNRVEVRTRTIGGMRAARKRLGAHAFVSRPDGDFCLTNHMGSHPTHVLTLHGSSAAAALALCELSRPEGALVASAV